MGAVERQRRMVSRAVRRFGGSSLVTLRRRHTLVEGIAGEVPESLSADGAQSSGSGTLRLRSSEGDLEGILPAGLRVTVGGQAYEVQADARASGGSILCTISPSLVANVDDGAAATLEAWREYTVDGMTGSRRLAMLGAESVVSEGQVVAIAALGAEVEPRVGDLVYLSGEAQELTEVRPVQSGDQPAGWVARWGAA